MLSNIDYVACHNVKGIYLIRYTAAFLFSQIITKCATIRGLIHQRNVPTMRGKRVADTMKIIRRLMSKEGQMLRGAAGGEGVVRAEISYLTFSQI